MSLEWILPLPISRVPIEQLHRRYIRTHPRISNNIGNHSVSESFRCPWAKLPGGSYSSCLIDSQLARLISLRSIYEWNDTFADKNCELVLDRITSTNHHLRTGRSAGLRSRWRNSWQIIIDRVAASDLRKHHESPRRASVITAWNCKSISRGYPFAPGRSGRILRPFEVWRSGDPLSAVVRTKRLVSHTNKC